MNNEIKELLTDIQNWMMENDYECGERGSDIYERISTFLRKDEAETNSPVHVIINGKPFTLPNSTLTYDVVMKLIAPEADHLFSMTYHRGKDNTEGTLYPKSKPAIVKNGTIVNAYYTGNA